VSASAIGYYGERGEETLAEDASPGSGFLPDTCVAWENASAPLSDAGIRLVWIRIGVVLDPAGGALKAMLPPFRMGLGGRLGHGRQWMSWISRNDLVSTFVRAVKDERLTAAINGTAPNPVRNAEFTRELAATLHRPALATVPAPLLRLLPGDMANEALLASARVLPRKLEQAGFQFQDPDLSIALRKMLQPSAAKLPAAPS
jgi:uncharacterized protein (TIGR01777 family)